jgi:hypothetical protein
MYGIKPSTDYHFIELKCSRSNLISAHLEKSAFLIDRAKTIHPELYVEQEMKRAKELRIKKL